MTGEALKVKCNYCNKNNDKDNNKTKINEDTTANCRCNHFMDDSDVDLI